MDRAARGVRSAPAGGRSGDSRSGGGGHLNALPGEQADRKLRWLYEHFRCPSCGSPLPPPLPHASEGVPRTAALHCGDCGRAYQVNDGVADFLDEGTRAEFGIVDTDLVSDHPFDGNALAIIDSVASSGGMVLDCGSGSKNVAFGHVIQTEVVGYPHVDVLAVNQRLPFADGSFDAAFSLDVLEHVDDPFTSAAELARVLRPGGVLYVDLPFLQTEHGYPHHYFNATRMGLRRLFAGRLDLVSHHVAASGHPILALYKMIEVYDNWLSEEARLRFRSLTMGEVLAGDFLGWLDDPVAQQLDVQGRWLTASSTQALFRKPGGDDGSGQPIEARQLPGFPEYGS